jgi:hypothetical protein
MTGLVNRVVARSLLRAARELDQLIVRKNVPVESELWKLQRYVSTI